MVNDRREFSQEVNSENSSNGTKALVCAVFDLNSYKKQPVPKIVSHASSVVSQNEKDRVRVLGSRARLKIKRYFPPASFRHLNHVPVTRLERRSRTAQITRGYVAHFLKCHHRLLLGN